MYLQLLRVLGDSLAGHFFSITAENEQQAVSRLTSFLVDTVGWSVAQDVTNTATDRDVVFSSSGEPGVPNGFTRYIRLRGVSNSIFLYTYEQFTTISVNTGELSDASYGKLLVGGDTQGFFLMAVADLERVVLLSESFDGVRRQAYVGRIKSYYNQQQHSYPNLIKGGEDAAYTWYYNINDRNAWMIGTEGLKAHYFAIEPLNNSGLLAGQSSDRDGSMILAAPVLVRNDPDPALGELVGEPRGVFRAPVETTSHTTFIKLKGEVYVVFESNGVPMAAGPIGTVVPSLQTNVS